MFQELENSEKTPESILPLTQAEIEGSSMISQETRKGPEHFEADTPITELKSPIGILPQKKQILRIEKELREKEGRNSENQEESQTKLSETPGSTTPPNLTSNTSSSSNNSPRYETITPTPEINESENADEVEVNLVMHIPEPEEITSDLDKSDEVEGHHKNQRYSYTANEIGKQSDNKSPEALMDSDNGNDSSGEAEDRKCRICGKIFNTEDDLLVHFEKTHIRIGSTVSSIFEPESPYPIQNELQVHSIETRQTLDANHPRNIIVEPRPIERRHSAELLTSGIRNPLATLPSQHPTSFRTTTGMVPLSYQVQHQQQAARQQQSILRDAQSANHFNAGIQCLIESILA